MSARPRRPLPLRALAGAGVLAAALALAACTSPVGTVASSDPPADAGSSASGSGAAPTCDTIIASSLVEQFAEIEWTARADPFYIGPHEIVGGVGCTWANYEVGATDVVQMYGWAPLSEDESATYEEYLESEGWVREEEDGVVYLTESMPSAEWADADGYGMTYAFGDGWVAVSDTKSGLDVIRWQG